MNKCRYFQLGRFLIFIVLGGIFILLILNEVVSLSMFFQMLNCNTPFLTKGIVDVLSSLSPFWTVWCILPLISKAIGWSPFRGSSFCIQTSLATGKAAPKIICFTGKGLPNLFNSWFWKLFLFCVIVHSYILTLLLLLLLWAVMFELNAFSRLCFPFLWITILRERY